MYNAKGKEKIFLENNLFAVWVYMNIALVALRLYTFQKTHQICEDTWSKTQVIKVFLNFNNLILNWLLEFAGSC